MHGRIKPNYHCSLLLKSYEIALVVFGRSYSDNCYTIYNRMRFREVIMMNYTDVSRTLALQSLLRLDWTYYRKELYIYEVCSK